MAGLENNIDIVLRRRHPPDHNLIRGVILHDIFQPIPVDEAQDQERNWFNLNEMDDKEAEQKFRFKKTDIPRLVRTLRIPDVIRTRSGYVTNSIEGMCILLRRLAYPNRLCDLQIIFHKSSSALSEICIFMNTFINDNFGHLLGDLGNHNWLNRERLEQYSETVSAKGGAVQNCWGFIDGTARAICRPSENQEDYYSGHKHFHCVKYQSVVTPDGITISEIGAFTGRRHDAGIFRESQFYAQLEQYARFPDRIFVLYGDQAYGIRQLLLSPFHGQDLNEAQQAFNASMSRVRQAVEWSFQKIIALFAFLDFKKNQKVMLQDIQEMYKVASILTNCHTCLYGSQTTNFFNIRPVTLEQYLNFIE